ncbi:MAG: choice-of-anchor tandem repeat NxxGxxAF-containing protein, partial [Planctomycetota bacterium]
MDTTVVADTTTVAPDGNGFFAEFGSPILNDAGQVAFEGCLTGTAGGDSDTSGIFLGDGSALTQVVRTGQAAPDANGSFSSVDFPALNDAGQAAFTASLTGTAGGGSGDSGVFLGDGSTLTRIARAGQVAADANGSFSYFTSPALNDAGHVAFLGRLTGTAGGNGAFSGIFLGDGS